MRTQQALTEATAVLDAAGVPGALRDARKLLAAALQIPADRLTVDLPDELTAQQSARFQDCIARRATREPISHILGYRLFYGRNFKVSEDVLDPRPETEILIKAALEGSFRSVLDLGTGSGCILLTLLSENSDAVGMGTDISAKALAVAQDNANRLSVPRDRVSFRQANWLSGVEGRFDLIVSNPPYISAAEMDDLAPEVRRYEPTLALTPGGDGLAAYRAITAGAPKHLHPGGWLMVEIGPTQAGEVSELLRRAGFGDIAILQDLDSRDRVAIGRKSA